MGKYETLQERPKKMFRIAFSGIAYITAHCELEAKAILQGITFNETPFRAIDSIRELDEDEKAEFGAPASPPRLLPIHY